MSNLHTIQLDKNAFKVTMICSAALLFKCVYTNTMVGGKRIKSGARPPEDEALFKTAGKQDFTGGSKVFKSEAEEKSAKEEENRAVRIAQNDLESIPVGLIMNWGSLLCHGSTNWHIYLTIAFTICRYGHTIAYSLKRQPSRAIFWFGAILSMFGFAINGVVGVLRI